jgi:hypothetical protein
VVLVNNATARGSFLGSPLYASARVQVLGQLPQTGFSFAGSVAKLRNFLTPWEDVEEAKAQNNVSESTDSSGMTGTIIWTLLVLAGLGGGVIVGRKFIH